MSVDSRLQEILNTFHQVLEEHTGQIESLKQKLEEKDILIERVFFFQIIVDIWNSCYYYIFYAFAYVFYYL